MRAMAMLLLLAVAAAGQVFEAAAIKAGDPAAPNSGWNQSPGRITIENMTLRPLVEYAFDVKEYQITGGPKWADTARYTIVAKMEHVDAETATRMSADPNIRAAMRVLLADRFQMVSHLETKELSGYALLPAKSGFKLKPVEPKNNTSNSTGNGRATFDHATLAAFAEGMCDVVDRPVVDETGIAGVYDIKLRWSPDDREAKGPSLFTAMQEQLGLRLEARKVPAKLVIIDKAEKPTED